MKKEEVKRFWEKLFANSFWPVYGSKCFYFNSAEKAQKITDEARKAMEPYREFFEGLDGID